MPGVYARPTRCPDRRGTVPTSGPRLVARRRTGTAQRTGPGRSHVPVRNADDPPPEARSRGRRPRSEEDTEHPLSLTTEPDDLRRLDAPTDATGEAERGRPPARTRRGIGANLRRAAPFVAGIVATFLAIAAFGIVNPGRPPLTTRDVDLAVASALASQTPPSAALAARLRRRPAGARRHPDRPAGHRRRARRGPRPRQRRRRQRRGASSSRRSTSSPAPTQITHHLRRRLDLERPGRHARPGQRTSPSSSPTSRRPASPPATLGNPGAMRIGSEAYVVGNPFGLAGSLSSGVVSGLDRSYEQPGTDITIERPDPGRRRGQSRATPAARSSTATAASSGS